MFRKEDENGGIYMMYTIQENYSRRWRRRRRRNARNSAETKHYKNPKNAESLRSRKLVLMAMICDQNKCVW
jgi:hypothetical protein